MPFSCTIGERRSRGTNIASETLRTWRLKGCEAIVPWWFVLESGDEFGTTVVLDRRVAESGQRGYQHYGKIKAPILRNSSSPERPREQRL